MFYDRHSVRNNAVMQKEVREKFFNSNFIACEHAYYIYMEMSPQKVSELPS